MSLITELHRLIQILILYTFKLIPLIICVQKIIYIYCHIIQDKSCLLTRDIYQIYLNLNFEDMCVLSSSTIQNLLIVHRVQTYL